MVAFRDSVAAVAPRPAVAAGACSTLHIWADVGGAGADFVGIPGATGTLAAEKKPQIAGVFTDLEVAAQPGLSARIDVDTRFITSPTALKLAAMVLGVACVVASIAALAVLDRRSRSGGDGHVRGLSSGVLFPSRGDGSGGSAWRPGSPISASSARCCCGI